MARQGFSTLAEYCVQNGGLQEKECGADGNCFYHCLAAANDMREWDGLDSLDEAAREEARGKLQQQMRYKTQHWLRDKASYVANNGQTLLDLLLTNGSSSFYKELLRTKRSVLPDDLADVALCMDLQDSDYFDSYLQSIQDSKVQQELMKLTEQVRAACSLSHPSAAKQRAKMIRLMLPPDLDRNGGRCPSICVAEAVWQKFLESVVTEGEWNEDICLVAAAACLQRPMSAVMVDDDGKMLSKFPMIFLPPGASEQEFSEESVVHLCNIGGTHWRLLWPQLGLQETVLDEDMDEDLQQALLLSMVPEEQQQRSQSKRKGSSSKVQGTRALKTPKTTATRSTRKAAAARRAPGRKAQIPG